MSSPKPGFVLAVALGLVTAACGAGAPSPAVPAVPGGGTSTTASGSAGSQSDAPLAKAEAYAECMRSHGVADFPDPVVTPSGGYGFRTAGVDPQSLAFRAAGQACNALAPAGWGSGGQPLSTAQQQLWLGWAKCIRSHGMPDFPDPTFSSGGAVHIDGGGAGVSPQLQSAMNGCRSQLPSSGGLGG